MTVLSVHYGVGLLLLVVALGAIVSGQARRIVVYVLALQLALGAYLWWSTKLAPPPAHWILAILVGGVWPIQNALERRGRPKAAVIGTGIVAVAILAYVIHLGMRAVAASSPAA